MVAAEAIARSNILNTAMVQSQGLTASIDTLLSSIVSSENAVSAMKPISLNVENLEDQVSEFKVRTNPIAAVKRVHQWSGNIYFISDTVIRKVFSFEVLRYV